MRPTAVTSCLLSTLILVLAAAPASADELRLSIAKPTVGIAAALGQTYVGGNRDAETVSLEGRLGFGRLELAAEIAKSEYDDERRVDRRIGGSIYLHLSKGELRPILSIGGGLLRADFTGGPQWDMAYGQIGAGLLRRLSDQIDISVEATIGKRKIIRSNLSIMTLALYYLPDEESFANLQLKLIIRL